MELSDISFPIPAADDFYDDPCFNTSDMHFFEDLDPRLVHVGLLKPDDSSSLSSCSPSSSSSSPSSLLHLHHHAEGEDDEHVRAPSGHHQDDGFYPVMEHYSGDSDASSPRSNCSDGMMDFNGPTCQSNRRGGYDSSTYFSQTANGGQKSDRRSVVSSLDCLSSIVERISTDTSSLMPAADAPGSPPSDQTGETAAPGPPRLPSPTASQDPNLIYQVL
ncbi:myoblast determination protein 1 homolog [Limanda limanda]|uniref:myoblast determination protein 1 homolog n=1 Tax=Limanda limanda TaxID=27771 RepID=UPI0029C87A07|nr:myoblast determination protein 1 homolog [Limanda limanda]